jgi:imidazolonepropionase-like amidohydrolase
MAFPPTGQPIVIGPKATSIPLRRLTRDAGENLHWAASSDRVYWSLGPELFERDLKDAFPFLPGAPEKPAEAPEKGRNISFTQDADKPSGGLALRGARIITMRGDEVIEKGTILINGNRIAAVGPAASLKIPVGTKVVDVSGKTIIPGLIDVHAHGAQAHNGFVPQQSWVNYAAMAFGVTTIHDPSNDTNAIFSASELAKAGLTVAPRTFSTGTILYGAGGDFRAEINSLDDARSHLRRLKAVGAFSVKSYNQPRRDQRQQVIAAARELGMMVVPEGGSLYEHNMTMVADGHTGIEHAVPVAHLYDDVLQFWSGTRTGYTPTLIVGYGGLWGENYWYQHSNVWENERLLRYVPREVVDPRSRRRTMAPEDDFNHLEIARSAKQLNDRGVSVQLGAHGQLQGLGPHWELWMFAQGGMTPMQALRAGTLNGARYLGLDKDIGSLEPGKLADLVVLDRNPLANIRDTEHVRFTMVNGRLFEAETMNETGNRVRVRAKFFFE